ncbi:hypothetical protein B0A52_08067 [Exophiala mesophila]|uniref:Uncharacterized protein n=1 Tax=Exophiala mesophila TaxID=212818 RepID=A0A438MZY2_EXOME|nr:hypothetical protein B0A52_08067 [Exophiala mesophila]
MASQTNGEVFDQPNETKFESPESVLPGKSVQQIKELIDSVKILSAGDSFKYADGLFNEMTRLRQAVKVNEDEVGRLQRQLQQSKANSKIAQQEFLESHQEAVQKIKEEKGDLRVKLDRIEKELDSQEKINKKQSEARQELQLENTSLSNKNQSLQESISQTKSKVKELESKSAAKDSTILQLQQNLELKEVDISNAEGSIKALEREKTGLRTQLDDTDRKLKTLMDFCYPLSSDSREEVRNSMKGVWRSCFDVVKTNVWKELPVAEKEEDIRAWTTLKHVPEATYATPVPYSNTRAAKQMRTFLVMAVLARSLTNHIFTPTYIVEEESELRDLLFEISDNAEKEFLRGMIMSLFEKKQREIASQRVSTVVREVLSPVQDLLGLDAAQKFGQELKSKIQEAKDIWWGLQRHQSHFEADIKCDIESWEWQSVRFSNDNDQMNSQAVDVEAFDTDEAVLTLFPRIFVVDGSRDTPIFPGVVLQKSQTASAEQEISQMAASSPIEGKPGRTYRSTRARRMTANSSGKIVRDDEEKVPFLGSRG